jgi:hypothetical protein
MALYCTPRYGHVAGEGVENCYSVGTCVWASLALSLDIVSDTGKIAVGKGAGAALCGLPIPHKQGVLQGRA